MEIYSHPAISDIINTQNNSVCFDCGFPKPKWASINNGIFLCLKCAGIHRNFGVRFSIIRSIQLENWDDKQIQFLKLGGNLNFKHFLSEYNINSNSNDNNLKYKSKCAEYYRKYLRSLVEKEINPNYIEENIQKPSLQEGIEIIDNSNNDIITNNDKIIESGQYKEEKEETFFGFVGNFFKKASKKVVDAGKDVGKKIEDLNITEKVVQTGNNAFDIVKKGGSIFINTTSDIAKKGGNLIVGAATEVKEKGGNLFQKIGVKAEAGFNAIKDTTKSIIIRKNEKTNDKKNDIKNVDNMNNNKKNDENKNKEEKNNNVQEKKEDEKKEDDKKEDDKKEDEKKDDDKKEDEKKEDEKKEDEKKDDEKKEDEKKEDENNNIQEKKDEENNNIEEKNNKILEKNEEEKKEDENNNISEKKVEDENKNTEEKGEN